MPWLCCLLCPAELVATSDQIVELRLQGLPGAQQWGDAYAGGEGGGVSEGRWPVAAAEQEQQRQEQQSCRVVLSTDILWQQLHDIQRARLG